MDTKLQQHIAFYLTGKRGESGLQPMDEQLRPALLARHGDLCSLRYDFPLILNREGAADRAVLSLSRLVDAAIAGLSDSPECGRVARHGHRIERELRRAIAVDGSGDFGERWQAAARVASGGDETVIDSANQLWAAFHASGDVVDVDAALPSRVIRHLWNAIQRERANAFREKTERLLLKLHDILAAELAGSAAGWTPERLRAGVGSSFATAFNFEAMSRVLVESKPSVELSDKRRARIESIIDVLERQRFYPIGTKGLEGFRFAFTRCSDALSAYQERHLAAVELVKTLAIAELEANGDYKESVHDALFDGFGANGLDAGQLAQLPDYMVWATAERLDAAEMARLSELLAAGLPFKVLLQTDDVLEPSAVAEGHVAFGLRARQFVDTAIGMTDVYVLQASAASLFRMRDAVSRGLAFAGRALFSVFSGTNDHTSDVPAYLVAAAATECRVFPSIVYDPSGGNDWATRLRVDDNPRAELDWTVHPFGYEDEQLQSRSETLAFTLADFMSMDSRFVRHFAVVPSGEMNGAMISVTEALDADLKGVPSKVPSITLVNNSGRLQRALIDYRTLSEARRCRSMWHSLQELAGIHNSHAERLLARERASQTRTADVAAGVGVATPPAKMQSVATVEAPRATTPESETGEPYIDTGRCTTCNECIQRNGKLFAYNENKQAYIADANAGTFRQLVEAAEGCQVSIIHPGKPRNPKEPGLEDLLVRAAAFN